MPRCYFITHPDVAIDPAVPVPAWPLSERGIKRMNEALQNPWVKTIGSIHCSTEQKAIDGARILAEHRKLEFTPHEDLGENDRSATGFLPPDEFERVADEFFALPERSIRGWETALAAQARVVAAVDRILTGSESHSGDIAIVAHGGIGALLLCHVGKMPIGREHDQPPTAGGNYFCFDTSSRALLRGWSSIDPVSS